MLDVAAVSYQIVLTKLDKLKKAEQEAIVPRIQSRSLPGIQLLTPKSLAPHRSKKPASMISKLAIHGLL